MRHRHRNFFIVMMLTGLLAAFVSLPSAQASPASPTHSPDVAPDLKKILERKRLIVAMTEFDRPPLFMTNANGHATGIELELAQAMADGLGVKLELNRSSKTFDEVIGKVTSGEADIAISKISQTFERAKLVQFSKPYLVLRHALILNRLKFAHATRHRDSSDVIRNFDGPLAVVKGSSYVEFAKRLFPKAQIREYERWQPDLIEAVSKGEVWAGYRDELEIKRVIKDHPDKALLLQSAILTDTYDGIAMAVPWRSNHVLAWVNIFLESRKLDLTVRKLLEQYSPSAVNR